jgi:preprotein translocase subunit SecY
MAKQPGLDFQSAKGGLGELKRRLLFVIGALIVFRIGSFIPIPGIDATVLAKLLEQQRGTIIEMFNMFSGGASSRASIFALGYHALYFGIDYYPALTVVHPPLAEIKKEGEAGRRKISQYTRYGTLVLAIFQSIGIATGLPNMPGMQGLVINPGFAFYLPLL